MSTSKVPAGMPATDLVLLAQLAQLLLLDSADSDVNLVHSTMNPTDSTTTPTVTEMMTVVSICLLFYQALRKEASHYSHSFYLVMTCPPGLLPR